MSRYATHGGNAVAANMLSTIAAKETNYKESIRVNHMLAKSSAKRIRELETMLHSGMIDGIMSAEELAAFFREQKDAVKKVAERNVERERSVHTFCSAVRTVQNQVQSSSQQQGDAENSSNNNDDNKNSLVDYQKAIDQAMEQHKAQRATTQILVHQEALYREVAEALGEPVAAAAKKGRGSGDDDDDIEIMQTETQGGSSLKCPITGCYMEDAVRNKVCGHVYSRAGITAHVANAARSRHCECPTAGCGNKTVTLSQLEEDVETVMNVKREQRRHALRMQQQASQQASSDLVDSDEE